MKFAIMTFHWTTADSFKYNRRYRRIIPMQRIAEFVTLVLEAGTLCPLEEY